MNFLTSIPLLIILIILFLGALLLSAFFLWSIIVNDLKGASFVRSELKRRRIMLKFAEIKPGEIVYDLGSGDGTLLLEAASSGAQVVGIEINHFLVWYSRLRIWSSGHKNIRVMRANFRDYPLHDADVVLMYLWRSTVRELTEKMSRELKSGTRVVSHAFPITAWKPQREEQMVFLYYV